MKQVYWALSAGAVWSAGLFAGLTMAGWCGGLHISCITILPFWIGTWMLLGFPIVLAECAAAGLIFKFVRWFKDPDVRIALIVVVAFLQAVVGYANGASLGAL